MITYSVSPAQPFVEVNTNGKRLSQQEFTKEKQKIKSLLPKVKGYLFFTTSDEYNNISNIYSNKSEIFGLNNLSLNPTLIRTNSVVEYECGITLNHQDEIHVFLANLENLKAKCHQKNHQYWDKTPPGKITLDYHSEYHLEHNYGNAELTIKQKQALTDRGFPDKILAQRKEFILKSVGIDLSIAMIDQSIINPNNNKGRHIQIIYKNNENAGYLKFKKPEIPSANATVCEIDEYSEHDAIYVNIHFTKKDSADKFDFDFDAQLRNIGRNFKYLTCDGQVSEIAGCTQQQLIAYFSNLKKDFQKLVNLEALGYKNCKNLYDTADKNFKDCVIKVASTTILGYSHQEKKIITNGAFPVNFNDDVNNNKVTENFLSLLIHNQKLEAPEDLHDILYPQSTTNSVASSDSSENEGNNKDDKDVIITQNKNSDDLDDQFASFGITADSTAQPEPTEEQISVVDPQAAPSVSEDVPSAIL